MKKEEKMQLISGLLVLVSIVAECICHYQYVNGMDETYMLIGWMTIGVLATAVCWPVGGFCSLLRCIPGSIFMSVIMPHNGLIESCDIMTNSMGVNAVIVLINIGVFFLWCIVMGVKECLKEKKEVSLEM